MALNIYELLLFGARANCVAGTPAPTLPSSQANACVSCAAGTYSNVTAAESNATCIPCATGTYSGVAGALNCSACPAGTYNAISSQTLISSCLSCAAGSFSLSGSSSCTQCPAGSYSVSSGSPSCTKCPAGWFSSVPGSTTDADCQQCPAGTYASSGSASCTPCPAGTFSTVVGAVNSSLCSVCAAGTYSNASSTACTSCPLGQYAFAGSGACAASIPSLSYSIYAGKHSTVCTILDAAGFTLKCWGKNTNGQLGLGDTADRGDNPGEMGALLPAVNLQSSLPVTSMCTGTSHTCVILGGSSVKCWGINTAGQLGYGDQVQRNSPPAATVNLGGKNASSIACGSQFTCASLQADGTVMCWGENTYGQIGDGSYTMRTSPVAVNLGTGRTAKAVYAGAVHTCALLENSQIKCWGANNFGGTSYGMLGTGETVNRNSPPATEVNLGTGRSVKALATGWYHNCAILDNNSVKCWGYYAGLGYGDTSGHRGDAANEMGDYLPPVNLQTSILPSQVAVGGYESCIMFVDGSMKCWGFNGNGETGYGDQTMKLSVPAQFINLGTGISATRIAMSLQNVCILTNNFRVRCWGVAKNGFLGDGQSSTIQISASLAPDINIGEFICTQCLPGTYVVTNCLQCANCSAGTFSSSNNSLQCTSCPAGSYSSTVGASSSSSCVSCPAGSYSTQAGSTNCTLCPGGTFSTTAGATNSSVCSGVCPAGSYSLPGNSSCTLCPAGTYSASPGTAACTPCPNNTFSPLPGSTQVSQCMPVVSNRMRVTMPPASLGCDTSGNIKTTTLSGLSFGNGTYSMDWSSWASGGFSSPRCFFDKSSTSGIFALQMYTASTGTYKGAADLAADGYKGEWIWVKAPFSAYLAGISIDHSGFASWIMISNYRIYARTDTNSWANLVTVTDALFPGGMHVLDFNSGSNTMYNTFAIEISKMVGGAPSDQTTNPKEITFLLDIPIPCPAGTYLYGTTSLCMSCPVGTYSSAVNALSNATCTKCPNGTYGDTTGMSVCTQCPVGTSSTVTGATSNASCASCPAGTYSANVASACITCPAGSYSISPGSSACTLCPAGSYSSTPGATSTDTCSNTCPAGSYSLAGASSCTQCPAGSFSSIAGAVNSSSCKQCPEGFYSPAGSVNCTACPAGTYSYAGSGVCDAGVQALATRSSIERVWPAGSIGYGGPEKTITVSGLSFGNGVYRIDWSTEYGTAERPPRVFSVGGGYWSGSGYAGGGIPLVAANYWLVSDYKGDWIWMQFPSPGSYVLKNIRFQRFAGDTLGIPIKYRVYGRNGAADSWNQLIDVTNGNSYTSDVHTSPTLSVTQTYDTFGLVVGQTGSGSLRLQKITFVIGEAGPCNPGYYAFNTSYCTQCPSGTYSNATGATQVSDCTQCRAGKYSPWAGKQFNTTCTSCGVGTYSAAGSSSCTSCLPGTFASSQDTALCPVCPAGTYSLIVGATNCTQCPPGTSSNATNATSIATCVKCAAGSIANTLGSATCTLCPAGYYANAEGTQCLACTSGSFSPVAGAAQCQLCPAGSFSKYEPKTYRYPSAALSSSSTQTSTTKVVDVSGQAYGNGKYFMDWSSTQTDGNYIPSQVYV